MVWALLVVWGIAVVTIVTLGVLLVWTLRRRMPPDRSQVQAEGLGAKDKEPLLFYYAKENVRSTTNGDVIVRIPGPAWEREWRSDLFRIEICPEDVSTVEVPADWGIVEVLAAYTLRAYRMTDVGTDIEMERFAAPIDVFLTTERAAQSLRLGAYEQGRWIVLPPAVHSPEVLETVDLAPGCEWAVASVAKMGRICLVDVPWYGEGGAGQADSSQ
jgi:hypothetical protein